MALQSIGNGYSLHKNPSQTSTQRQLDVTLVSFLPKYFEVRRLAHSLHSGPHPRHSQAQFWKIELSPRNQCVGARTRRSTHYLSPAALMGPLIGCNPRPCDDTTCHHIATSPVNTMRLFKVGPASTTLAQQ